MNSMGTTRVGNAGSKYSGQCNYTSGDALQQFKSAMLDTLGYAPESIIGDGNLHRTKDNNGKNNGAYVLHLDGRAAGYFQDFKQGIKVRWKLEGDFKPLTQAERQAFAFERQRQADERQTEETNRHNKAVEKAAYFRSRSTPVINHQYLINKGVNPHNVRCYRGSLVIPLYDENGVLVSLQFIGDDGTKRMMKGGKAQGSWCSIGKLEPGGVILVCEGWATGSSLYDATGHFTIVAFSAGNLKAVAELTRKHHQNSEIIICGDNDLSGVGQKAAKAAALAVGGKYILPATVGHDWNDSLNMEVCHE
jgi:putative DNA primase/helicase